MSLDLIVLSAFLCPPGLVSASSTDFFWSCGQDKCAYPKQFCDNDEKTCRNCNRNLCLDSISFPKQCGKFCSEAIATPEDKVTPGDQNTGNTAHAQMVTYLTIGLGLLVYIAVVVTVIMVILFYIICKGHQRKLLKCLYTSKTDEQPEHLPEVVVSDQPGEKDVLLAVDDPPSESSLPEYSSNLPNTTVKAVLSNNGKECGNGFLANNGARNTSFQPHQQDNQTPDASVIGNPNRQCPETYVCNPETNREGGHEKPIQCLEVEENMGLDDIGQRCRRNISTEINSHGGYNTLHDTKTLGAFDSTEVKSVK